MTSLAEDAIWSDQPIEGVPPKSRPRLESVDMLRGLVMVIMVLDHVRDFVGRIKLNPLDMASTTVPLFFTRWITHFCAPTFVFLAGTGIFLAGSRGMSRAEQSRFLIVRGLWLIVLEVTVIRFGLTFDPTFRFVPLTVIWVIGVSMIAMAALVHLPTAVVGAIGLAMIVSHNAFDGVTADRFGRFADVWRLLHQRGILTFQPGGARIFTLYPLIPWIGVMASGYAFGALLRIPHAPVRRRILLGLGLAMTAGFVALRASNLYGDPRPWEVQSRGPEFTVLSFLNCEKYPPSLLFLLMTLGPAIVLLSVFDRGVGRLGRPLITLGRVPLFYYVMQWYVIHLLAIGVSWAVGQPYRWLIGNGPFNAPENYGFGLPMVYLMTAVTLAILYPFCRWFAGVKARRRDGWLSYL